MEYKERINLINDLIREIKRDYKESDYIESDKLQVSMHRVIDNFVSYINKSELSKYINFYDIADLKTIDKGMLPKESDMKYDRCLLYCLIEQDIYNTNIEKKVKE